jgi:DNA-binding MltR family transcriptional regulator
MTKKMRIEKLRNQLNKATEQYGFNDNRTIQIRIKLFNLLNF